MSCTGHSDFTMDLTQMARAGKIDPILGRDGYCERYTVLLAVTVRSVHRPELSGISLPHLHALVRACAPEGAALQCLVFVLAVWMADTPERLLFL